MRLRLTFLGIAWLMQQLPRMMISADFGAWKAWSDHHDRCDREGISLQKVDGSAGREWPLRANSATLIHHDDVCLMRLPAGWSRRCLSGRLLIGCLLGLMRVHMAFFNKKMLAPIPLSIDYHTSAACIAAELRTARSAGGGVFPSPRNGLAAHSSRRLPNFGIDDDSHQLSLRSSGATFT
jgi:hypothetical protein